MAETTRPRTGNPAASPVETPKYEMPKSGATFHEVADKSIAHTKGTLKNAKAATEEATQLFQHTYMAAARGATDYNLKLIEISRINTTAAFDYVHELLGVKSPSEFVELSSAHARKQFETMAAQTKELTALAQKVAEPIKAGITGALNNNA